MIHLVRKEKEEFVRGLSEAVSRVYECNLCEDSGRYYDKKIRNHVDCENCGDKFIEERFIRNALRSEGDIVDRNLIEKINLSGKINHGVLLLACSEPVSRLSIGKTTIGKTLTMKCWYNTILRREKGFSNKLFYIREIDLFPILRHRKEEVTESFFESFLERKPEYIFIEDAFREEHYKDTGADREYAIRGHANFTRFIDILSRSRGWKINVCCIDGNNGPESMFKGSLTENQKSLVERIYEMTGGRK